MTPSQIKQDPDQRNYTFMKKHLVTPAILIIALGLLLSACTGALPASGWPGLSATTDMAYVADGQFIYAVRLSDGSQAWRYPEKVNARQTFYAEPVLTSDGQLLVPSFDKSLYSFNPTSGQVNWSYATNDRLIASPLVEGDRIYQPSVDSTLYALDTKGNLQWKFKAGNSLWSRPAADENNLYFTSMDHSLYGVSKANGRKVWSVELGAASVGTPAVSAKGVIYIGTLDKEMIALDTANGNVLWRTATDDGVWSGPALTADGLYFGDMSGKFYALNPESGTITWTFQPGGAIIGTPAITANSLVFGTEAGSLVAVDFKGAQVWKREIGGKLYTTPVYTGTRYLAAVTQGDKILSVIDENGNLVWNFVPPD